MPISVFSDRMSESIWWELPELDGEAVFAGEYPEGLSGDGCGYPACASGDSVDFSDAAMTRLHRSGLKPLHDRMLNKAMSLESIERRISVVQAEISQVWNSALPKDEKYRQISAKENEIALLRAGQFTFARAGFYRAA